MRPFVAYCVEAEGRSNLTTGLRQSIFLIGLFGKVNRTKKTCPLETEVCAEYDLKFEIKYIMYSDPCYAVADPP
jgi:hypothetical protein